MDPRRASKLKYMVHQNMDVGGKNVMAFAIHTIYFDSTGNHIHRELIHLKDASNNIALQAKSLILTF